MIPIITIALGLLIYWLNFGWTMVTEGSLMLVIASTFVVVGLISLLKSIQYRK